MKILLMSPPNQRKKGLYKGALLPPLGIAYIAAVLEKNGHEVKIIDGYVLSAVNGYDFDDLKRDIEKEKPEIVGIGCMTSSIVFAKKSFDVVKSVSKEIITVLGGPHITALPETLNSIDSLDYGVYGEGEYTMLEIVKRLEKKQKLEGIKGLIWKENGKIKYETREFIKNIDEIPFPARHLLPMKLYRPSIANYRKLPATAMMTSRGCPFGCVFCHKPIFGNSFRPHSVKRVIEEIEFLVKEYGIRDIQFYDDTFAMDRKRVEGICNELIKRNLNIVWNCATRVHTVDPELLKLMKKAGCYEIAYGIESGSERIIKMINKGITKDIAERAIKWTREAGIESRTYFMLGLPTQTKEEMKETIEYAKNLDPDHAQFTLVNPLPDTKLWEMCQKDGKVNVGDWSNFTMYTKSKVLPYVPSTVTGDELKKIYNKAYINFYLRPSYILRQIMKIRDFKDLIRTLIGFTAVVTK